MKNFTRRQSVGNAAADAAESGLGVSTPVKKGASHRFKSGPVSLNKKPLVESGLVIGCGKAAVA